MSYQPWPWHTWHTWHTDGRTNTFQVLGASVHHRSGAAVGQQLRLATSQHIQHTPIAEHSEYRTVIMLSECMCNLLRMPPHSQVVDFSIATDTPSLNYLQMFQEMVRSGSGLSCDAYVTKERLLICNNRQPLFQVVLPRPVPCQGRSAGGLPQRRIGDRRRRQLFRQGCDCATVANMQVF